MCVSVCTSPKDPRFLSILTWKGVCACGAIYIQYIYISTGIFKNVITLDIILISTWTVLHLIFYEVVSACQNACHTFTSSATCVGTHTVSTEWNAITQKIAFQAGLLILFCFTNPFSKHWSNILQLHPKAVCKICMSKFVLRSAGFSSKMLNGTSKRNDYSLQISGSPKK